MTTRLVQINVVVTDKNGAPVRDLKKDDFAIFDQGREQKISFFSKEGDEGSTPNSAPLPTGTVSNRRTTFTSAGQTAPASLTVILLDGLNTSFPDQHDAKEALIKFLGQLQPGDRVAIYTLKHEIAFKRNAQGRQAALLDVLIVVFDASGQAVHQEGQNIDLNLEDPVYEKLLQTGINMTVTSEVPPNSARIRVVVHDVSTGTSGLSTCR